MGRRVALAISLFAVVLVMNLGGWDLQEPDETRYGEIAREIVETGQYTLLHLNGAVYCDKPPLFFWLVGFSSRLLDDPREAPSALAARFPSALAATGVLILTYFLSAALFGPLAGFLSVLILFTTVYFFSIALDAHLDTTLSFWTTLAIFLFFQGYTRERHRRWLFLSSYAAMGLGVLTKGPVGFLVPFITIILFLGFKRDLQALRRADLGKGILLVIGVVALWLVPACLQGGEEYTRNVLFLQNVGRAVNSYAHKMPFYFYLLNFPADFLPWIFFLPSACIHYLRRREERSSILLPLAWFCGTFVFFSLVSGKRTLYLLPIYPATAMLMAKFWADLMTGDDSAPRAPGLVAYPAAVFFSFLIVTGGGGWLVSAYYPGLIGRFAPVSHDLAPALGCLLLAGCTGMALFVTKTARVRSILSLVVATMFVVIVCLVLQIFPAVHNGNSPRPFIERAQRIVGDSPLAASCNPTPFNYFMHRYPIEVIDPAQVTARLSSSPDLFVLGKVRHSAKLPSFPDPFAVLEKATVDNATYYLVGRKKAAGP